ARREERTRAPSRSGADASAHRELERHRDDERAIVCLARHRREGRGAVDRGDGRFVQHLVAGTLRDLARQKLALPADRKADHDRADAPGAWRYLLARDFGIELAAVG